jgi:hypothetical protein
MSECERAREQFAGGIKDDESHKNDNKANGDDERDRSDNKRAHARAARMSDQPREEHSVITG